MEKTTSILETVFAKPSENVRGTIAAFAVIKGKETRVAFAMLFTDRPPEVTMSVSKRVGLDDVLVIADVLNEFSARVKELDAAR